MAHYDFDKNALAEIIEGSLPADMDAASKKTKIAYELNKIKGATSVAKNDLGFLAAYLPRNEQKPDEVVSIATAKAVVAHFMTQYPLEMDDYFVAFNEYLHNVQKNNADYNYKMIQSEGVKYIEQPYSYVFVKPFAKQVESMLELGDEAFEFSEDNFLYEKDENMRAEYLLRKVNENVKDLVDWPEMNYYAISGKGLKEMCQAPLEAYNLVRRQPA